MATFHRMLGAVLLALVAAGSAVRAESVAPRQTAQAGQAAQPEAELAQKAAARKPEPQDQKPLSPEDAALVRELALLERVELLKHLELFEPAGNQRVRPAKNGSP